MKELKLENNYIKTDNENIALLSGEIHYWRLSPQYWKKCLLRAKDMGLKVIATYVCWDYHEYEEGKFDFTGETDPQRDLKGFLDLLTEMGFWIIIRPGPYTYTEWNNAGIPTYIVKYHRMHEEFLKAAERYMKNVVDILKPYFYTNNGRIILFQADNEIDPFINSYGKQLGLMGGNSEFQNFLKKIYDNKIDILNDKWKTHFKNWEDICAYQNNPNNDILIKKRVLDYRKFIYSYSKQKAKWMVNKYKELGVNLPIYLNTYPDVEYQDWAAFSEIVDIVGNDHYPSALFKRLDNEENINRHRMTYANTTSKIPYIAEFECGIWHEYHYLIGILPENQYTLLALTALQSGIKGWNWYMLVNRDNWYMSPINEKGFIRTPIYDRLKDIVSAFFKMNVPELKKCCDICVNFSPMQSAMKELNLNEPILQAINNADLDYEIFDTRIGLKENKPVMFYYGTNQLEKKSQELIHDYIKDGNTFIVFDNYPIMNSNNERLNILDIKEPNYIMDEKTVDIFIGSEIVRTKTPLMCYKNLEIEKIIAKKVFVKKEIEENENHENIGEGCEFEIGYIQKIGKGKLIVCGCNPTSDIVKAILKYLKIPLYCNSCIDKVRSTLLKKDKKTYYLILTNYSEEEKGVSIDLDSGLFSSKPNYEVILSSSSQLPTIKISKQCVYCNIQAKDGIIIKLEEKI